MNVNIKLSFEQAYALQHILNCAVAGGATAPNTRLSVTNELANLATAAHARAYDKKTGAK